MYEALQQMFMMQSQELKGSLHLYLMYGQVQMSQVNAGSYSYSHLAFKLPLGVISTYYFLCKEHKENCFVDLVLFNFEVNYISMTGQLDFIYGLISLYGYEYFI